MILNQGQTCHKYIDGEKSGATTALTLIMSMSQISETKSVGASI